MHGYVVSNNSLATQTKNSGGINNDTLTDEFTVIDDSYGSDYDNENQFFFCYKTSIYFDKYELQTGNLGPPG